MRETHEQVQFQQKTFIYVHIIYLTSAPEYNCAYSHLLSMWKCKQTTSNISYNKITFNNSSFFSHTCTFISCRYIIPPTHESSNHKAQRDNNGLLVASDRGNRHRVAGWTLAAFMSLGQLIVRCICVHTFSCTGTSKKGV